MTSSREKKLRQLERLGLLLSFEDQFLCHQPSQLEVEQCANEVECPVIDLPDNKALFVVWLSLWAEQPGVRLWDFRFEPPWRDHGFVRLPNFADSHFGDYYRLPGGWEYPRAEVLNLNFLKDGWRLPNTRVEGVLCALSDTPIPPEYKHGALIPVAVRFFDRAGQQLAKTTVSLWVDRLTHHSQRMQQAEEGRAGKPPRAPIAAAKSATVPSPRSTLYGHPGGKTDSRGPALCRETGSLPADEVREGGHGLVCSENEERHGFSDGAKEK